MKMNKIKHILEVWKRWDKNGWTDWAATYTRVSDGRKVFIDQVPDSNIRCAVREMNGDEYGNTYETANWVSATEMRGIRKRFSDQPSLYASGDSLAKEIQKELRRQVKEAKR